jgi:hypothetical protein
MTTKSIPDIVSTHAPLRPINRAANPAIQAVSKGKNIKVGYIVELVLKKSNGGIV